MCSVLDCIANSRSRGFCNRHYRRFLKYGDPHGGGGFKGDGCISHHGYRVINNKYEHRILMEAKLGRKLLDHENIHHINGDRLDNRIENLELWSTSQPKGQRVIDKILWANEILSLYSEIDL